MRDYVAWLNGCSVAQGTLSEVERKARAIVATPLWREHTPSPTKLRITRGARQFFVKAVDVA